MDKSSNATSSTILKNNSAQSDKPVPSTYPDSVRMTAERLANAVIKIQQEGVKGGRNE
jgi:hypothetical protein